MKSIKYVIITALLTVFCCAKAQDKVAVSSVKINNQVSLTATKAQVIQNLGQPTSSEPFESEIYGRTMELLKYGDSEVYIDQGELRSFEIKSSQLFLQIGSTQIRIGNNISTLQSVFPSSYNSRLSHYNGAAVVLSLEATVNGQTFLVDSAIAVAFDSTSGLITSIDFVDF